MTSFRYRKNRLHCEDVPVEEIARRAGTPCYVYSQSALERNFRAFDGAFDSVPHLTCYAVKANSNLALLGIFRRLGSGFDIVSGGELKRVLRAGGEPGRVVFSGVGKTVEEIDLALARGILQFNVESAAELELLESRARALKKKAGISLRVNPDVDAETHPYIATGLRENKFGVSMRTAVDLFRRYERSRHLDIAGIGFHIGSQITRLDPFVAALKRLKKLALDCRASGIDFRHLDLGGGLGIRYRDEEPPSPDEYAAALLREMRDLECTLLLEPGRILVGNAGILLTTVLLTKDNEGKHFVVVDAAMNDLIRPSLYGSFHEIVPATRRPGRTRKTVDVVGPVCETGDFLARARDMHGVAAGEVLALMTAGAYCFVQSSNYNARLRAPEVLVKGARIKIIRKRETFEDLVRGESARAL